VKKYHIVSFDYWTMTQACDTMSEKAAQAAKSENILFPERR
jgi:hypothetical protein